MNEGMIKPMRWRYFVVQFSRDSRETSLATVLNNAGAEGWELVQVGLIEDPAHGGKLREAIFKKPDVLPPGVTLTRSTEPMTQKPRRKR